MFNEGNQIHNFMSSSGSGTLINYGSGSDFLTSYGSGSGSTSQKLRFLRFRFHNTANHSRDSTSIAERTSASAVPIAAQEKTGTSGDAGNSRGFQNCGYVNTRDACNNRDIKKACNCTLAKGTPETLETLAA